jgi:hypothetical protein
MGVCRAKAKAKEQESERMKNRPGLFAAKAGAAFSLLLVMGVAANAQGRYRGNYYSKGDVERIIKRVETRSDSFARLVDRSLDRGALDGTRAEDRINDQIKDLERALDELRSEFDRSDGWRATRSEVQMVLRESDEINHIVRNRRLSSRIEREWAAVRSDLNRLAGIYDLPRLRS